MTNFYKALNYLVLCSLKSTNADGSVCKISKSKLVQMLLSSSIKGTINSSTKNMMYVVDFMTLMLVVTTLPIIFEDLVAS